MLVTGASRGIGAATARRAAESGYNVIVNYASDDAGANTVVSDIRRAGGVAFAMSADITVDEEVESLFAQAIRTFGRVDCLVNNAGITGPLTRFEDLSSSVLRRVLEVNVVGMMLSSRAAVRHMSRTRGGQGGTIVNLSSRSAQLGGAGEWLQYSASKGAVESFTVGLAREVAGEAIRVNAVAPGLIETSIHGTAGDPDRVARLGHTIPIGRAGSADEVAEAIIWLASEAASYVTGAIIPVSGGR